MTQQVYGLPPPEAPEPERTPVATAAMIGGLVFVALAFVIAGIGFVAGWWGPKHADEASEPTPEVTPAKQPEAEPEPKPLELAGAELMPAVESRPQLDVDLEDPFAGAEPVPEIPPSGKSRPTSSASTGGGGNTGGASGEAAGSGDARPRVRVAFVISKHYERLELKIGGKIVKFTGDKSILLPPGGYRVELRKGPEDPWAAAGLITLELGNRYQVTLLDPPLAKLEVMQ